MRQLQESIRPEVGFLVGLQSHLDVRYLHLEENGSDCDWFGTT